MKKMTEEERIRELREEHQFTEGEVRNMKREIERRKQVVWYCAFCGKYHTKLSKRYDLSGWRKRSNDRGKDSVCGKGLLFIRLLKDSLGS